MISRAKQKLIESPLKYEELVQGDKDEKIVDIIDRGKKCNCISLLGLSYFVLE